MSHRASAGLDGGVNLSYIITPFLDMSFQLLAFFIMTYHPSALEGHIDGRLVPLEAAAVVPVPADKVTLPENVDIELNLSVRVKIGAVAKGQQEGKRVDGDPSYFQVQEPQAALPELINESHEGSIEAAYQELEKHLKLLAKKYGPAKTKIKIEADGNLRHMYVIRVFEVCRQAGYQDISFVAPKATQKPK